MNQAITSDVTALSTDGAWLADFLGRKVDLTIPAHELTELDARLQRIQFTEFLQIIEIARPAKAATVQAYQRWINANPGSQHLFAAWYNLAAELSAAGDRNNAMIANRNALALKPDFYQAAINLGLAHEAEKRFDEALETWQRAIQPDEARTALLNHRGRLLEGLKRFDQAERALRLSLQSVPMQPDAIQHWVHLRQKMCKWPIFGNDAVDLSSDELGINMGPLGALAVFDEIGMQYRIAEAWLNRKVPPAPVRLSPPEGYAHDRIRIGYLSSDFCMHAMSFLITELFERHDRSQFEVYGYCSTVEDGSEVRKRVIRAFDKYTYVRPMTDEQVAQKIREDEIDILVDLNGLTLGGRLQALRLKPAPVQITYLGYIGSVPLPELDYIICDEYVIPRAVADSYWPKPLYLPGSYQSNDTKLPVGQPTSREEAGIPLDKFVFCCFSNHYKITEEIFAAWMAILKRVENSVLWLAGDNTWSRTNLIAAAVRHGIAADRIVFTDRVAPAQYLARMSLGDLFLDTFPYNAGTVASDALRMGLPLLTLSGQSFVSRMAGSLLSSIGRGEEIATDLKQYIEIAVSLATNKRKYKKVRDSLAGDQWRRTIGNIELFTNQLESVLRSVVKRPGTSASK